MKKYDVFVHASKTQGFEDAISELEKQQREHKDALVAEARKILEAGGIEQKISPYMRARWSVHVDKPYHGREASVWIHGEPEYPYEGDGEWRFSYEELARADEIAATIDWLVERKKTRREREDARRELEAATKRMEELS